jgi:hypothetical protein
MESCGLVRQISKKSVYEEVYGDMDFLFSFRCAEGSVAMARVALRRGILQPRDPGSLPAPKRDQRIRGVCRRGATDVMKYEFPIVLLTPRHLFTSS